MIKMDSFGSVGMTLLVGALASGCHTVADAETGPKLALYQADGTLSDVDFKGNGVGSTVDVDRDRRGVEFEWGDEGPRKFVRVYTEKFGAPLPTLDRSPSVRLYGVRGGMRGAIALGDRYDDLTFRLPWAVDAALSAGEENGADPDIIVYGELTADFGIGMHWLGFTPSVGLALSNVTGKLIPPDAGPGAPASFHEPEQSLSAFSTGFYFEIGFKHRESPWQFLFRTQTGDYESTTFGIGYHF